MNHDADHTEYAQIQLKEARRRLDSVKDRINEVTRKSMQVAINTDSGNVISPSDMGDVDEEKIEYRIIGKERNEEKNIEGHIQNIIIDCQMCIELSVKSMFKCVGQDFDYSHGINFKSGNTKGFNNKIPSEFSRKDDVIRAIFLTQVWESFYQIAKYGVPELNAGPSTVFKIADGEQAINDASFCVGLAEDLLEFFDK